MRKTFKILIALALAKLAIKILKSRKTKEWIMITRERIEDEIDERKKTDGLSIDLNLDTSKLEDTIQGIREEMEQAQEDEQPSDLYNEFHPQNLDNIDDVAEVLRRSIEHYEKNGGNEFKKGWF